jgi:hypothetical protein
VKAVAEQWKSALAATELAEDAAWDAGPEAWRSWSHRTELVIAVVDALDQAVARMEELNQVADISAETFPHRCGWPTINAADFDDLNVDAPLTAAGAQS